MKCLVASAYLRFCFSFLPVGTFACAALLLAAGLNADVVDYALAKELVYQQTSDNTAPITLLQAELIGNFAVNNPGDVANVSLGGGAGLTYATINGGFDWEAGATFATQAELDSAFPDVATYTLNAGGGTLGAISESISFSSAHAFPSTPFFSGTVFSDAQTMNPSSEFTFTWNAPPADGFQFFVTEVGSELRVYDHDGFGSADTSTTVSAKTFDLGVTYQASLVFFDVIEGTRESFSTGEEFTGNIKRTTFQFTTTAVPEPSSIAVIGLCLIAVAVRRRGRVRG